MRSRRCFLLVLLLAGLAVTPTPPTSAVAPLELYATFRSMGIIAPIGSVDDGDGDAMAHVEYRVSNSDSYRQGFPLSRVAETRFVGSLFFLKPGTCYDVRVTFTDPDRGPLDGTVADGAACTRPELTIPSARHSYHVSPSGSGTACTALAPCSLTAGLTRAEPGDEVLLRRGVYYQGEIVLPRSGAPGAPIVIRSHSAGSIGILGAEAAILDGADPGSSAFDWSHQGGGVYRTTINVPTPHLVIADGKRLFPYRTLSELRDLSHGGTPGFYSDGTQLTVHLAGDADPNDATMVVSRHNHAFYVAQDYVYFIDLAFRHYGQGEWSKAIYFDDASDNLVQSCVFAHNDVGIGIKRDSHRNVIQDSEFYDTIADWPWEAIKDVGGLEDGGIVFYDPATGRGNVIRRNVFHDDFDGLHVCPAVTAALTNETDVYENVVYHMGDDGLETDGQCSNVRLWGNAFHDVLMGISLAPVYTGPVYAIRNLIYRTGAGNNDYSGSPFKFNSGYGRSGPMYLLHNTADAVLPGNNGLHIKAPGTWDLIYARNNVWSGTQYALDNHNDTQPVDFDYDDLYTTDPERFVYWGDDPGAQVPDLPALQSLTGQEAHGVSVAPGFVDAPGGDYSLSPDSQLIDASVPIPGINDDFTGQAPDIGVFEHPGLGFTLGASPSSRAINPGATASYLIGAHPSNGCSYTVTLRTASPSASLAVSLQPPEVSPPGEAILTVADVASPPGNWYTIPVTGTGGGFTKTVCVELLVGGTLLHLPTILKT